MNSMHSAKINFKILSIGVLSLALTISLQPAGKCDTTITTTEIMACGPLFSIDSNADGKTAAERTYIVQKNLDNALVAARHRTPGAVRVAFENNNPIVTLDNFYIVTADRNSAIRANTSQEQLAAKWADSIRRCLADTAMVDKYISMLTGDFKKVSKATSLDRTDVAVMPWGTNLPVALNNELSVPSLKLGSKVTASLVTDVPLGPNFSTYLPAGTLALGEMIDAEPNNPNNFAGHHSLMPQFFALQTPDGAQIPISGHILGGVNSWRAISINPLQPTSDSRVQAERFIGINQVVPFSGTSSKSFISESSNLNSSSNLKIETSSHIANQSQCFPGVVAGAWRSYDEDFFTQEAFPKLILSKGSDLSIPQGERMTLQLSATSTLAITNAAPSNESIASARFNFGM